MPIRTPAEFFRRLAADEEPDAELVRRFAADRDGAAFAALVRRHGPMVFGVCRRALGDHHLAEDAFQAVFVVLARKAAAVRPPGAVGGWLYGVARRAAAEARARRRRQREAFPGDLPDRPAPAAEPDDTAEAVGRAIDALPDHLRAAVLLCEVEGVGRAAAARRLGIPAGTLSSRLASARKRLAARLGGRGLGAILVAGPVAFPDRLARAAVARADGATAGTVGELARGVLQAMTHAKWKVAAAVVAVLAAGSIVGSRPGDSPPAAGSKAPAAKPPQWKTALTVTNKGAVTAVALGADMLAVADDGPQPPPLRLWDPSSGKPHPLEVRGGWPNQPIDALRFLPDERFLVAAAPPGWVTRYENRLGGMVGETMGVGGVAWSQDLGTTVVHVPGRPIKLTVHGDMWADIQLMIRPRGGLEFPKGVTVARAGVAVSGDDRLLAVAADGAEVGLYDPHTLEELRTITPPKGTKVTAVKLSDDGRRLVAVGADGFAVVYDTGTGAEACRLKGHDGPVRAVAFAPDGKRVVTACGNTARVFDAATGRPLGTLPHKDEVTAVAFDAAGRRLVTGSADKTATVWEPSP
jgi:RNA polymerase sigma factor (sigma-70 family)